MVIKGDNVYLNCQCKRSHNNKGCDWSRRKAVANQRVSSCMKSNEIKTKLFYMYAKDINKISDDMNNSGEQQHIYSLNNQLCDRHVKQIFF